MLLSVGRSDFLCLGGTEMRHANSHEIAREISKMNQFRSII
jgi:hypothetical protein